MNFVAAMLSLFFFSQTAWADDSQATYKRLVQARSLKCTFRVGTQADWAGGKVKTQAVADDEMVLHFDGIDLKKGTARLIGGVGAADVATIPTPANLTFIERTDSGNLNFTSVFPSYAKGSQDFVAVTSRHVMLPGHPLPSQYHGTCQVWE